MFYLNSRSDEVLWNCQDLKITFDLWEKIETFRKLFFFEVDDDDDKEFHLGGSKAIWSDTHNFHEF